MERRIILAGLLTGAAFAAGGPALAQSSPTPAMTPTPGTAPGLSDAVKTHIAATMAAGARSLVTSRIAKSKLKHPMGRQFAGFEAAEQEGIADVLRGRATPGPKPAGAIEAPTDAEAEAALDAEAEAALDAEGRAAVAGFRDMKEGPEFEKAYIQAQVAGHKKLLAIQDAYLQTADDAEETAIAKLAKGRIQEHLVILADIEKHLG